MTNLDINTPRGQVTLQQEERAAEIFWRNYPRMEYICTPKSSPCVIDAIIADGGVLSAVVETKCRDMSLGHLRDAFMFRWLVTHEKLIKAAAVAQQLYIPLVGFLYLVPSDVLLVKKLFCPDSKWLVQLNDAETVTQATVNGGMATRRNAFIDMSKAKVLHP